MGHGRLAVDRAGEERRGQLDLRYRPAAALGVVADQPVQRAVQVRFRNLQRAGGLLAEHGQEPAPVLYPAVGLLEEPREAVQEQRVADLGQQGAEGFPQRPGGGGRRRQQGPYGVRGYLPQRPRAGKVTGGHEVPEGLRRHTACACGHRGRVVGDPALVHHVGPPVRRPGLRIARGDVVAPVQQQPPVRAGDVEQPPGDGRTGQPAAVRQGTGRGRSRSFDAVAVVADLSRHAVVGDPEAQVGAGGARPPGPMAMALRRSCTVRTGQLARHQSSSPSSSPATASRASQPGSSRMPARSVAVSGATRSMPASRSRRPGSCATASRESVP